MPQLNSIGLSQTDIFISTSDPQQLESLGSGALQAGIDRFMSGDYKGAVQEFQRAVGLSQYSSYAVDAASYLAEAYLKLDKTEKAIDAYETAVRLDPQRDDTRIQLGNLFYSQQRYDEARQQYQEAVRINPSANNRFSLGQAFLKTGRFRAAEAEFRAIERMEPESPNGPYGYGLTLYAQKRHEEAIRQFQAAVDLDRNFYDAYAEMGYAYADLGDMDRAQDMVDFLDIRSPALAKTLSGYMYKVDAPEISFVNATSTFPHYLSSRTPVSALDSYLTGAGAEQVFTMKFQFSKVMERASVENIHNWHIQRSAANGPGQAYNFGLPIPDTEITPALFPELVIYDAEGMSATVYFRIKQNVTADGTIDPSHIEFRFNGVDSYGLAMDRSFDQFTGFSGIF
jgi:Tfp pilus assembly protein PilF